MQHLEGLATPSPQLPRGSRLRVATQLTISALLHVSAAIGVVALFARGIAAPPLAAPPKTSEPVKISRFVFIARDPRPSGGGGGGGNRERGPIRRAEGVGHDSITVRIAKPLMAAPREAPDHALLSGVLLDARPLASGTANIPGLPDDGVSFGTSLGPGTGGGVGTGAGTGIGPGTGPGVGPGSGGGTGGGVYRPGGSVTTPRVITQVKPKYTEDALVRRIQGTVVLEMIVTREGTPAAIAVVRSLDPGGLDGAAVDAAKQWRFEPGRLAGTPVDVLVTLMLDFRIQ
ncbi:MAG TPA: energy transducer TonB [Vicinamibacterales bacterium]|nr:energy transducer TonB [Vicinamibacterales bacterium]